MAIKIQKEIFAGIRVCILYNGDKDTPLWQLFRVVFILQVVCIDKHHDCDERICFPNNGSHENRKNTPF